MSTNEKNFNIYEPFIKKNYSPVSILPYDIKMPENKEKREQQKFDLFVDFNEKYSWLEPYSRSLTKDDLGKYVTKVTHSIYMGVVDLSYTNRIFVLKRIDIIDNPCGAKLEHDCSKQKCTLVCKKCKIVFYCSKECQVKDWKRHKELCGSEKLNNIEKMIVQDILSVSLDSNVTPEFHDGWIVLDELPDDIKKKLPEEISLENYKEFLSEKS